MLFSDRPSKSFGYLRITYDHECVYPTLIPRANIALCTQILITRIERGTEVIYFIDSIFFSN